MKRIILFVILPLGPMVAEQNNLFSELYSHGAIVGIRTVVRTVMGEASLLFGGHGGYIMNNSLSAGSGYRNSAFTGPSGVVASDVASIPLIDNPIPTSEKSGGVSALDRLIKGVS